MQHVISYDLARGLHIIAVIAWISGLLMLPRFYAYITGAQRGGELEEKMLKAAKSLRTIILTPALVLAWSFGLFLFGTYLAPEVLSAPETSLSAIPHWFWFKLTLVIGLSLYHSFLITEGRALVAGKRRHSERFWRIMSEIPFIIAIGVVLLATVEP
ncbi:MAG: CopD family protein [Terricaulis sp.]